MNLQEELKALKERIAELEELAKEEQEFPQEGYEFWFITSSGDVARMFWHDDLGQEQSLSIGNVFKTSEEAEFSVEKLKVEAELRKFSRLFADGEENNHIKYSPSFDELSVLTSFSYQDQGVFYFESREKVQQAIDTVGEERIKKYIFGVEG